MSPRQLPTRQLGRDGPQVPQIGFGLMELSTGYVDTILLVALKTCEYDISADTGLALTKNASRC